MRSVLRRQHRTKPSSGSFWDMPRGSAGNLQLSADAYSRGLRLRPSPLDGLSGLAQTYSTMGRTAEAERLLNQVLSAEPKRINDAVLLGELLLRSGEYAAALDVLGRAEQIQPGARSELLMALAYKRQNATRSGKPLS